MPMPIEPRKPKSAQAAHVPEGVFEGQSMYTSDFTGKDVFNFYFLNGLYDDVSEECFGFSE